MKQFFFGFASFITKLIKITKEKISLIVPSNSNAPNSESDSFTWMFFMMIAAVILFLMRPSSLRRRGNESLNKPSPENNVSFDSFYFTSFHLFVTDSVGSEINGKVFHTSSSNSIRKLIQEIPLQFFLPEFGQQPAAAP